MRAGQLERLTVNYSFVSGLLSLGEFIINLTNLPSQRGKCINHVERDINICLTLTESITWDAAGGLLLFFFSNSLVFFSLLFSGEIGGAGLAIPLKQFVLQLPAHPSVAQRPSAPQGIILSDLCWWTTANYSVHQFLSVWCHYMAFCSDTLTHGDQGYDPARNMATKKHINQHMVPAPQAHTQTMQRC